MDMVQFEKVKRHFKRHRIVYVGATCIVLGAGIAYFTMPIMKKLFISPELLGTASPELLGTGERTTSSFSPK